MRSMTFISVTSFLLLSPASSQQGSGPWFWSGPIHPWSGPGQGLNKWGSWGVWSVCSRSCGGGASVRSRTCITRSLDERPCPGESRQYKICNTKDCPLGSMSFRELQCQAYNHRPVVSGSSSFTWRPFNSGADPCVLSCLAVGHMFYLNFGKVLDGTSCGTGSVCVNGRCLEPGCDLVLGSGITADACMICGGNNRSCLHHQQLFKPEGTLLGYSEVAMIPAGATSILVTDNSRNYLVLQNGRSEYIINGDWTISHPGEYTVAGTKLLYRRSADKWESLELSGPTREDLHLQVLSTEPNTGVQFSYWLPPEKYFLFHGPKSSLGHSPLTSSVTVATTASVSMTTKYIAVRPPRAKPPRQTSSLVPKTRIGSRLAQDQDSAWNLVHRQRCGACLKVRGRRERRRQFCSKEFVVRVHVVSVQPWGSEARYEVQILESYRNTFPLLRREFLWAPDPCCPLLDRGGQYILMLRRHVNHEVTLNRLLLEPESYSAPYRPKEDLHMRALQGSCDN